MKCYKHCEKEWKICHLLKGRNKSQYSKFLALDNIIGISKGWHGWGEMTDLILNIDEWEHG